MKIIKTSLLLLFLIACIHAKSQSIVVTYLAGQDNCNAPPEGGTYTVVGTLNGKNQYSSNATHFIEWDGTKWIFRSFTSLGGWTTIYTNLSATPVPPCTGWTATFGCFIPTFTGGCVDPLIATTSKTNVTCNGGSNGQASVSASGGTSPYSYSWSPSGGTGAIATGLSAGTYTCTITDAGSQVITKTFNVTQPTVITATTSQTNIICNGGTTGIASISASGGTGSLAYSWSPSGGTGATATGLSAGNYTCIISDVNSCSITKTVTLAQPPAITATTSQTNIICNGGSTGKASVSASGGTGSLAYSWSPSGGTGAMATGLSVGNYTCTITDANGCSIFKTFTLTEPTVITATTSQTNVICNGGTTGIASVSASGGTGSLAYSWLPSGGTGATATGLSAGNYTCTISDANSCSIAKTFVLTQPSALLVNAAANNVTVCAGNASTLTANASGGTGSIAYSWVSGPTNSVNVVNPTTTTTYTVNVTDANSCANSATVSVIANSCTQAAALNFDGANDRVNLGNGITTALSGGTKVSVEAWVKPSSVSGLGCIIGNYSTGTSGLQILLRRSGNSYYEFWVGNGGSWYNTNSVATPSLNVWQHVAATWDGTVAKIYVNGVLSGTTTPAMSTLGNASNNPVWLGSNTINENFAGNIDEVRIWNVARTQCEINSYKNCEIPTASTGLLANYHFNQGLDASSNPTVTTLTDVSGSAYTGTLINLALTGSTSNWVAPGGVITGSVTPANLTITVGSTVTNQVICSGNSTTLNGTGANTYVWTGGVINGVSFSPTVTATYTVTGTNTLTGCFNTAIITVTVNNCVPGEALNFDGVNDNVNLGTSLGSALNGTNKITAEAWVKPTTTAGPFRIIVGNYSTPSNLMQFCLRQQGNTYVFFIGTGSPGVYNAVNAVNTVTTGVWQHVAGTWDGSVARIYINGALTNTASISYPGFGASTNSVVIGTNTVPEPWFGDIDEVRIWSRALCQGEIQNNMNGEIATTGNGLLANYHFNHGITTVANPTVNILADASGNGYTGTLTNVALTGTVSNWVAPGGVVSGNNATSFVSPTITIAGVSSICSGSSATLTASGNVSTYMWVSGPTTASYAITPSVTSTYSVVGTNSLGCASNVETTSVTVNTLPTIIVNSGAICAGQSFTMVPGGASTYTFSSGTDVVTPTADMTYSVSGTDANGCVSGADAVSSVTVHPLPVIISETGDVTVCGDASGTFSLVASNTDSYSWQYSLNSGSPNTIDGTYGETGYTTAVMQIPTLESEGWDGYDIECVLTSVEGCTVVSAPKFITVNPLPTISVNSGAICAGSSFTMVPTGATTYTYSGGSDVVMPTSDASYTVTGSDANGCENNAVSTVTVNALPNVTASTSNTLLCVGQTATLSVSGATTYTWNTTENTASIAVSPTVQTTYTANGTDANGCSNNTTVTQDVSACTGIATLSNDASINVYPNPNNGLFVIELTSTSKVTVMNALGEIVIAETFEAGKNSVNINNESAGVYFVKVMTNNKQQIIKMIKE